MIVCLRSAERTYADLAIAGSELEALEGLLRGPDFRLVYMAVCLGELRHHRADGSKEDDLALTRGSCARRGASARIAIRPLCPCASACELSSAFAEEVAEFPLSSPSAVLRNQAANVDWQQIGGIEVGERTPFEPDPVFLRRDIAIFD